jgi:hypothetical protein
MDILRLRKRFSQYSEMRHVNKSTKEIPWWTLANLDTGHFIALNQV